MGTTTPCLLALLIEYILIWSPKTRLVDRSASSIGVAVNPMNEALGIACRRFWASSLYWLLWASSAIMIMFFLFVSNGYSSALFFPNFWIVAKTYAIIFLIMWIRATLPRLRADQLMAFSWKFLLPLALVNLVIVAVWKVVS